MLEILNRLVHLKHIQAGEGVQRIEHYFEVLPIKPNRKEIKMAVV